MDTDGHGWETKLTASRRVQASCSRPRRMWFRACSHDDKVGDANAWFLHNIRVHPCPSVVKKGTCRCDTLCQKYVNFPHCSTDMNCFRITEIGIRPRMTRRARMTFHIRVLGV